jgi:hypothetical protein
MDLEFFGEIGGVSVGVVDKARIKVILESRGSESVNLFAGSSEGRIRIEGSRGTV